MLKRAKIKVESDGATEILHSVQNDKYRENSSSTLGGEVSRSGGGENVEKSKDERIKIKVESDGATEILHSVQDDKYRENSSSTPGGEVSRSGGGEGCVKVRKLPMHCL